MEVGVRFVRMIVPLLSGTSWKRKLRSEGRLAPQDFGIRPFVTLEKGLQVIRRFAKKVSVQKGMRRRDFKGGVDGVQVAGLSVLI